jgi:hypothetical protein
MLVLDKITLSFAEFSLLKDNVVLIDYLNETPLNVEKGIQLVETINKLAHNHPAAAIHNVGDKYIFTTDAMRFMGSQLNTNDHHYVARAIVARNPAARISINNFVNLHKPLIPTKLFSEVDEAYAWVESVLAGMK